MSTQTADLDGAGEADRIIEEAGGWRLFMREASRTVPVDAPIFEPATIRARPKAALGRAFQLAKSGRTDAARKQVTAFDEVMTSDALDPLVKADLDLVDIHVRVYEDKVFSSADAERLRQILSLLPEGDLIGRALAYNHLCTVTLHFGDFDKAQEYAETASLLYRQHGAEFGSLHLHAHLGQIRLMRGDITGAEAQFDDMEARLSKLTDQPPPLRAVARALRSEVAYEMNDLDGSAQLLNDALQSAEDTDAWFDVLASAYRVNTRLAFARAGLPGALTALAHAEHIARERGMPRLLRLMRIERVRALTLSGELEIALKEMREIGLEPRHPDWDETDDWALRQCSSFVTVARWLVRARRAREALDYLGPAEDFAIRGGQLLSLAKLRVVRAAAQWRLNRRGEAANVLLSAIRLLGRQPFRRFILDEGSEIRPVVQAALDGDRLRTPLGREQRHRLSELTHYWVTHPASAQTVHSKPSEGGLPPSFATRKRYLELLATGLSNKEIGRTMGVTVNTVKYHLKLIFKDLHVDNRVRAVHRARELGIIDE